MGKLMRSGKVEVVVETAPEDVWALVVDPTRVGEWSHECHEAAWIDGATAAEPSARFRGRNKTGRYGWGRICEVVEINAPHEFAWRTISSRMYPDSTEWRIRVEPHESGTRIVQTFEVLKLSAFMERVFWLVVPAHRDRLPALEDDMRRLGAAAAANASV